MIKWTILIVELIIAACIFLCFHKFLLSKKVKIIQILFFVLTICTFFISSSLSSTVPASKRILTVTALGEKNGQAENSQIYWQDLKLDGMSVGIPIPTSGSWSWFHDSYCWFEEGDQRRQEDTTPSITCEIEIARDTQLIFSSNKWKGIVKIELDQHTVTLDTYSDCEDSTVISVSLPGPNFTQICHAVFVSVVAFGVCQTVISAFFSALIILGQKAVNNVIGRQIQSGPIRKLLSYQFLFEELVARDFKKRYKRTVLGIIWSVLSPLLQLIVMWLVFSQFFGRNTSHYVIYLFAGNIIYSYFTESTNTGMLSLIENASIFTKVNIPKYLFLFSKNISSLINFSLTLVIFFVFTAIDGLEFTWKFCLLLYPITCLILFNMGIGLILSALFVFFKDIQYLWAIFTQLLMYMSAIFYTIDQYSYNVQCLFLLNPMYLFIRYFRKIVIEATVPTIWFHLLMAAYVLIFLTIGCWMYKKYNTRFLYYV